MISLIICAHNEEKNMGNLLNDLSKEIKTIKDSIEIFLCLSDCNDKTEKIAKDISKKNKLKIKIIRTPRGKIVSQKIALKLINKRSEEIIFLDSDIKLTKGAIINILKESRKYPSVKMFYSKGKPVRKKGLWYNFMNVRTLNPKYVIAKEDVSKFHPFDKNKRKKIFATGGIYLLRFGVYDIDSGAMGDDSYLTHLIYSRYGPGTIKEAESSVFIYQPVQTLSSWISKWRRIWSDLNSIYQTHPEFRYLKKYMDLKIDYLSLIKDRKYGLIFLFVFERVWNSLGKIALKPFYYKSTNWKQLSDTKEIKND